MFRALWVTFFLWSLTKINCTVKNEFHVWKMISAGAILFCDMQYCDTRCDIFAEIQICIASVASHSQIRHTRVYETHGFVFCTLFQMMRRQRRVTYHARSKILVTLYLHRMQLYTKLSETYQNKFVREEHVPFLAIFRPVWQIYHQKTT